MTRQGGLWPVPIRGLVSCLRFEGGCMTPPVGERKPVFYVKISGVPGLHSWQSTGPGSSGVVESENSLR